MLVALHCDPTLKLPNIFSDSSEEEDDSDSDSEDGTAEVGGSLPR